METLGLFQKQYKHRSFNTEFVANHYYFMDALLPWWNTGVWYYGAFVDKVHAFNFACWQRDYDIHSMQPFPKSNFLWAFWQHGNTTVGVLLKYTHLIRIKAWLAVRNYMYVFVLNKVWYRKVLPGSSFLKANSNFYMGFERVSRNVLMQCFRKHSRRSSYQIFSQKVDVLCLLKGGLWPSQKSFTNPLTECLFCRCQST